MNQHFINLTIKGYNNKIIVIFKYGGLSIIGTAAVLKTVHVKACGSSSLSSSAIKNNLDWRYSLCDINCFDKELIHNEQQT